jgi:hypothetical protein
VNQPQEKTEQKSGRHKWLRRSLLAVIIIIAIIVLARVTLPYSIIFGATTWLEKQGVHTTIEDIRIDVIGGKFTLVNATGTIDQTPAFHVGLIDIHWQWRPLSKKVIHIERVALQGLKLDIAQYSDAIDVAGITVPLGSETPPVTDTPDENDTIDWAASLNEIDFSDLDVCYTKYVSTQATAGKPALDYCTAFKALRWNGNIGFATDSELARQQDVPLVSDGDFSLSGFTVTDRRLGRTLLNSSQTTLSHVSIKGLNQISIDEIDIDKLSALQRNDEQHRDTVRFNSLQIAGIRLKNLNALNIDSIRLDAPGLFIAKDAGGAWEYAQWISELPAAGENKDDANDNAGAFLLAIHQIQVNDSDFCYDEAAGQLYYCLNLAALDWKGSAAFDKEPLYVTGELQLDGLKIRNRTLQRDLLDLGRLSATSIDIKKTTSVKIGTLVIDSLRALQRTDKADDDSLKFKQLDISSIAYNDNKLLNIGKIKLDGLGVSLSMNKDGMWEFDKWKTASTDAASPKIKTDKSEEGGDKLDIALGEFSLSTDQNIEFGDESMSPPLEIGLNKLDFNIKQLDSRKTDQQSPFSLNASTTRRGTIKVAGVVSPFEVKPSFDAKGRISGIDLRALSPATKKYVGHIIRSGQLDADLKLLSKDGQLDSNIGLVLNQFELKAMSAKDAKDLEQTFGMPINQSLSLLRDKDNSIHLDIPITGDVTAPDFDPTDAIIKATTNATSFTLITFFTPYGLAYAGGNILFDLATALNFDPLIFDAGSATLNKASLDQLNKLADLMTERPQVHLTLCGLSNGNDRIRLYPDTAVADGSKPVALKPEQEAQLLKLANDRQNSTKNYLIDKKGLSHDRLILCEPAYNADKDAIGGVEINI